MAASPPIPMSDISLDDDQELLQEAAFLRGRCCYWMPCMQSHRYSADHLGSNWWQPIKEPGHRWWCKSLTPFRKIKEWSELIAGSKWKTFICRFKKKKRPKHTKFHYDPASYSLNFDQGAPGCVKDDLLFRDFSSRYASVPISTKSSMDLGKDGLTFM